MGKVKGKHRLDRFYRLAKEHGYRSRAAWKLVQIDAKYSFLRSAHSILDLCAAPGGWMQAAVERVPVGSLIIGVDLVPIAPIRGAVSIEEDITKPDCRSKVKRVMEKHGCRAFDVVLHDGSPNVGGAWVQEATSQNALVIDSLKLGVQFLVPKGTFVTKVFRSQDYTSVLYCLKQLFEKVEVYKPTASRSSSAEIYVLGLKYKAPAKIDPRLLDVKHLFQGASEPKKVVDVLRGTKQKRHRDGYEDGETILRKVCSAADFIWSVSPLEVLGSVTAISFEDQTCLPIKDHPLTTEEVKFLCDDLRVLGKHDFKHLLRWRIQIRKALSSARKADAPPAPSAGHERQEDEGDRLLNEMEELTYAMEHKKKREKKLQAKRLVKDKARKATGMQVDVMEDGYIDHDLFSLSSIKAKQDLIAVDSIQYDDDDDDYGDTKGSESEEICKEADVDSSTDLDSDEEHRRYDDQMEELLDEAYERYVAKRDGSTKQRKRARQKNSKDDQLLEEGGDGDGAIPSDQDSDDGEHEANPLMVTLDDGEGPTQEEITQKWFSQDIFAEAAVEDDAVLEKKKKKNGHELDMDDIEGERRFSLPEKPKEMSVHQPDLPKAKEYDFEIVPAPPTDSSDSSSSDEEDDDSKAEILAYAKKMLRKKQREQILDDAYNKYMFHDQNLPKWFADEERRFSRPAKPVTKEEVAAMRAQFKEINARPAKKVAEAKARKKRASMRKLEKVRKKASSISDQADVSDRSKQKMIAQLYKKAEPQRPKKEYVVAKRGVQVRAGKGKKLVDRRMKKDGRTRGMGKPGGKGKRGKVQQRGKGSMKSSAKKAKTGSRGKKMGGKHEP